MKTLRVGILGYGWAAQAHIEAINATRQAQVVAVQSSRDLEGAELSARHKSPIRVHRDVETLLADPGIDVVDITGYPSLHSRQAIAAARAGKHIILEKPMANSLEEVRAIADAAQQYNVQGCVCFELRYSEQMIVTRALIDEGLLGELHYGEIDYYHGIGPWYGQFRWNTGKVEGGSALLSAGCHALDALLLCMGAEVETVTSLGTRSRSEIFAPYEYDTTSVTLVKFKNGAVGKCAAVIDCLQPYYLHTHLVGSRGSLLDGKFHSQKLKSDKGRWSDLAVRLADSGDVNDHPYQTQFQSFFDALEQGCAMPLTSFQDALRTFEVIFAADRSAAQGGVPVRVNP
jgi:predicted dehydrogenase